MTLLLVLMEVWHAIFWLFSTRLMGFFVDLARPGGRVAKCKHYHSKIDLVCRAFMPWTINRGHCDGVILGYYFEYKLETCWNWELEVVMLWNGRSCNGDVILDGYRQKVEGISGHRVSGWISRCIEGETSGHLFGLEVRLGDNPARRWGTWDCAFPCTTNELNVRISHGKISDGMGWEVCLEYCLA